MRAILVAGVLAAAALAVSFLPGCRSTGPDKNTVSAVCRLESLSGSKVSGSVMFTPIGKGWIHMYATVHGLTPGTHAIHIHEKGDCTSKDGMSTGGHWNPTGRKHGKWAQSDGAFHLGDIGNLEAGFDGTATLELTTDLWAIGGNGLNNILGKAIIIHGGADDFTTDPTGNAGNRIGCGVILRAAK
jgi:Cu-Zn family superoxide dismutase